jgi:riboflavin kinase / FMN adenylyltransferase
MLAPLPEIKITILFIGGAIVAPLYNHDTLRILQFHSQTQLLDQAQRALPAVVTIGNFDGVHLGHQTLVRAVVTQAKAQKLAAWAVIFEPHPREFFSPDSAPARINNLRNKLARLKKLGLDGVLVARFNQAFAQLSAQAFVDQVLVAKLNTKHLIVGDDFRFGAGRTGDFNALQTMGQAAGFKAEQLNTITHTVSIQSQVRVSSSVLREALARGAFDLTEELLGSSYCIEGHVIHGKALGRQWGFPTLNIPTGPWRPALHGIYVVTVHGERSIFGRPQQGVASLGTRPAVDLDGRYLLEVHLLDWQGDAYGQLVSVEFHHKLRAEAHFADFDLLKAQIQRDCDAAKSWFTNTTTL